MKTSDDGGTDGKHVTYLKSPQLWRSHEPDIFDFINTKISSGKRLLLHIEKSNHCKGIDFISKNIENLKIRNDILRNSCLKSNSDVIFFDPDNGIEVASANKKSIHKYVTWNEIIQTVNSGKSVLIYQHFSRSNREAFIKNKLQEIKQKIGIIPISLRVKHSVYFLIPQKKHKKQIRESLKTFSKIWNI